MSQNRIYGPKVTITSDDLSIVAPLGVTPLTFKAETDASGTNTKYKSIYIGADAGVNSTIASTSNIVLGTLSGGAITSAARSTFIGTESGTSVTIQNDNVFVGQQSGWKCTGNANVSVGNQTLLNCTADGNTVLGYTAGNKMTSGAANTLCGSSSGYNITTGANNFITGFGAAPSLTTGSRNILLCTNVAGSNAGQLSTGSDNIIIGSDCAAADAGKIIIGKVGVQTSTTCAGISGVSQTGPNVAVTVNGSGQLGVGAVSLREFKDDIVAINEEENHQKLMQVLPRNYTYKAWTDKVLQHGVIIDEVKEVFPELVGQCPDPVSGEKKDFYVNYEQFIALLIADLQYAWKSMHNLEARLVALEQK